MAFLSITSDNEKLSYILYKNPNTGLIPKEHRQGFLFGYYTTDTDTGEINEQEYNIAFIDQPDEISFGKPDQEFAYLDANEYDSPQFLLSACREYLNHLSTDTPKESIVEIDTPKDITITIPYLHIHNDMYIKKFNEALPDLSIETEELTKNRYKVTITGNCTIRYAVDYLQLLGGFLLIISPTDSVYLQDSFVEKFIGILRRLKPTYYLTSLFKTHFLSRSPKVFESLKDQLKDCVKEEVEFCFGSSQTARINKVEELLNFGNKIYDIGCGEGTYFNLARKIDPKMYHAADKSEKAVSAANSRAHRKRLENVTAEQLTVDELFDKYPLEENDEIIVAEVIEHMPKKEASLFVQSILRRAFNDPNIKIGRIIISTPNKNFNENWNFDEDQMRHDDHDWEPTPEEFASFIFNAISESGCKARSEFTTAGDIVNGQGLTQLVIITPPISND